MNKYEQIIKQIIETSPSWEKDGGGIRGRTLAPLIGGASSPNLMGDPIPQQFTQQRSSLIQQQDDPIPKLNLPATTGEGGAIVSHPFKITSRQNPDNENQYFVTINAGTINGIIAGNWESSFSVPSDAVRYIVLKCTTNGLVVTSSTLAAENASPASPPAEKWALSGSFDVLIGAVRGASVKQVVFDNLAATGVKRLTTEKENIQLQQIPYDNWYAWVVT